MIVDIKTLKPNEVSSRPKLSTCVYVLEDKDGERRNWNAIYMNHWEIVKQKIFFETEEEMLESLTGDEKE